MQDQDGRADSSAAGGSILTAMRQNYNDFPSALKRLTQFILQKPEEIISLNLAQLAKSAGVGEATVVRLAKHLGLPGFQEFKLELAMQIAERGKHKDEQLLDEEITAGDDAAAIARKLKSGVVLALDENISALNAGALESIALTVSKARRVMLVGMGNSALSAIYLKNKLARIGINAVYENFAHFMYTTASLLSPADIMLAFSQKGRSAETIKAVKIAKKAGAVSVAVTNQPKSALGKLADFVLYSGNSEGYLQGDSVATLTSQLHVCEIIYTLVVNQNPLKAAKTKQLTIQAISEPD